jgi:hypothetical protein
MRFRRRRRSSDGGETADGRRNMLAGRHTWGETPDGTYATHETNGTEEDPSYKSHWSYRSYPLTALRAARYRSALLGPLAPY